MTDITTTTAAADFDTSLLPASSTGFERAMERACRVADEVWAAGGRVGDIKHDIPDAAIPFLIWELGLEPVMPWLRDPRRALAEGRAWQRIRGTPQSITQALGWIDVAALVEDEPDGSWWDLFQLGLGVLPETGQRAAIVALTRLSRPAHTDLIRVYHGYDLRPVLINGHGRINGGALINDWSGVWQEQATGEPVKWSLGTTVLGRLDATSPRPGGRTARHIEMCGRLMSGGGFRINKNLVQGPEILNRRFALGSQLRIERQNRVDLSGRGPHPRTPWPATPWGVPAISAAALTRLVRRQRTPLTTAPTFRPARQIDRRAQRSGLLFGRVKARGWQQIERQPQRLPAPLAGWPRGAWKPAPWGTPWPDATGFWRTEENA